jgi:NAD(P)-dependent dehydrogenase (short-subunit alcohol dehydrogenase family)
VIVTGGSSGIGRAVADGGLTAGYRFTDWDAVERPAAPRELRRP